MAHEAGWFPDPGKPDQWRWWDGEQWTDRVSTGVESAQEAATGSTSRRLPAWAWVLIALAAVGALAVLSPVIAVVALVVLITGIVALVRGTPTWLRLRTRKLAVGVTGAAAALLVVAGSVSAAVGTAGSRPAELVAAESASPTVAATASPTPRPSVTPTPVTTVREDVVAEPIPFERTTTEDATWGRGQTRVSVAGVNGELTRTYRVTLVDGVEVGREQVAEVMTVAPVSEVTVIGTYDPPPPPPAPAPQGNCDPNYADGCVPIASDVDCAGGSGDGPAYFSGTARVVGVDVYDLDRDGDGIACQS